MKVRITSLGGMLSVGCRMATHRQGRRYASTWMLDLGALRCHHRRLASALARNCLVYEPPFPLDRHSHWRTGDVCAKGRVQGNRWLPRPCLDGRCCAVKKFKFHWAPALPAKPGGDFRSPLGTARRVANHLKMWSLRLAYFLGADPARLAKAYGYEHRDN